MKFKAKLIAGIGMALAVLILIGVLSYRNVLRSRENVRWVMHTHIVLENLDDLLTTIVDAETGQRGFILTGNESYLQPYKDSAKIARERLGGLRRLTSDNPIQQKNLDRLDPVVTERFTVLEQVVDARRREGLEAAVSVLEQDAGKRYMEQIRAILTDMKAEEDRLLVLRMAAADASSARTGQALLLGDIVSFLFLFLAGVAIHQEMARRRQAEEEVRALNADLERRVANRTAELSERTKDLARSNAELQQFAYVASHDLQEPLRMVASFTQLLAKRYSDKLGDDAREFIHYAVDGATRLQTLITDLLSYSRVGTQAKPLQQTNCGVVLDRVLNTLKLAIQDTEAAITHDPLPVVMADEVQLGQLFQNLITNAIKFKSEERPRVHISAARAGLAWTISVSDNGIGIAEEHAERIWVIFQRLHTKAEYPGTGIGLAVCKKIVERHGGTIWVEPAPGGGSTFRFTIPVCEPPTLPEKRKEDEFRVPVARC